MRQGTGASPVVGLAVLRDLFEGKKLIQALTWLSVAMALAPALGPVLGGFLQYILVGELH